MEVYIILNKENGFFIIGHACPMATGQFQWYLIDDPNNPCEQKIKDEIHESIVLDNEWIQKNALHKWLACHCNIDGEKYDEICCYLTEDFLTMIKNNHFNRVDIIGEDGNIKYKYIEDIN